MKRISFIIALSIIFTSYLFSQSEKNEIIEMYTLTNANTIVATEIDTTIFSEPVNEQEEQIDLSKYNFYNDYLAYLKKNNFMHTDIADTLVVKRNSIISSVKVGGGVLFGFVSVGMDIPIYYRFNIAAELGCMTGGIEGICTDLYYGFGLGYIAVRTRDDKFILKLNSYIGKISNLSTKKLINTDKLSFHIGSDILFKMSKHTYISISIASFVVQSPYYVVQSSSPYFTTLKYKTGFVPQISLGLNVMF